MTSVFVLLGVRNLSSPCVPSMRDRRRKKLVVVNHLLDKRIIRSGFHHVCVVAERRGVIQRPMLLLQLLNLRDVFGLRDRGSNNPGHVVGDILTVHGCHRSKFGVTRYHCAVRMRFIRKSPERLRRDSLADSYNLAAP